MVRIGVIARQSGPRIALAAPWALSHHLEDFTHALRRARANFATALIKR